MVSDLLILQVLRIVYTGIPMGTHFHQVNADLFPFEVRRNRWLLYNILCPVSYGSLDRVLLHFVLLSESMNPLVRGKFL
jgi:hypothetical protein